MSLSHQLEKWVKADLITPEQQENILAHQKNQSTQRWKNGVGMTGFFSILLGLSLLVATNWQAIPDMVKLCGHAGINLIITFAIWHWRNNTARAYMREIAIFMLWGLTLTLIALIGQITQSGGQDYEALRLWFWLTTPMILLFARSRYITILWAITFFLYVPYDILSIIFDVTDSITVRNCAVLAAGFFIPILTWLFSQWPAFKNMNKEIAGALRTISIFMTVLWTSVANMGMYEFATNQTTLIVSAFFACAVALVHFVLSIRTNVITQQRTDIDVLCLSALFATLPYITGYDFTHIFLMLSFICFWLLIGFVWQQAGRTRLVSLAIQIIALRLFYGFIELFGSLAFSGFGLILIGLVLIGLMKGAKIIDTRLKDSTS